MIGTVYEISGAQGAERVVVIAYDEDQGKNRGPYRAQIRLSEVSGDDAPEVDGLMKFELDEAASKETGDRFTNVAGSAQVAPADASLE